MSRLNDTEIIILRSLMMRGGSVRPVSVPKWHRKPAIPLWRRRLVDVWFRKVPGEGSFGPLFSLTIIGAQVASTLVPRLGDSQGLWRSE